MFLAPRMLGCALVTLGTLLTLPLPGVAQERGPIRILVGFPPGGGTDAIVRFVTERLAEPLGQAVIIENRLGVGGRAAAEALLGATPNGQTYMGAPNAVPTFQSLLEADRFKWNFLRDFEAVAGIASYPLGMSVSLATGVTNAQEFVRWARANPAKANFGTPGAGGQNHFLGVQFAKLAGIELPLVPYKGSPPLMTDLLGGHLPAAVTLMDQMLSQHRSGKTRIIGVFTEKRSDLMPDIPTFLEQGFNITLGEGWIGLWAPGKTPAGEMNRMRSALQRVLSNPQVREGMMSKLAAVPQFRDGAEMLRVQRAEISGWEPIIRESGFKAE